MSRGTQRRPLESVRVQIHELEAGTAVGEAKRRLSTDTARGSGDEDHLALEPAAHARTSVLRAASFATPRSAPKRRT